MQFPRPMQRGVGFVAACFVFYFVVLFLNTWSPGFIGHPREIRDKEPPVLIYAGTKFFNMDITTKRFLSVCRSSKDWCSISENSADLPRADAVILHNADFGRFTSPDVYGSRNLAIPYVLWSLESPMNDLFRPDKDQINWTMTPRRDADIWYPYGHMVKRTEAITVDFDAIWAMKNESLPPATWLASNCMARNGRTRVVEELEGHGLKIDRWGSCGGQKAPGCAGVDKQGWDCVVELIKPYKFYVGFENSDCTDYVTEKFYETIRSRTAVPLVGRRKIYEDVGIPSSAFIALDDFASVDAMAKHVVDVAANKEKYLAYHKWREEYEVIPEHHDSTGYCELCRRLSARKKMTPQERSASSKSYEDVNRWHTDGICDPEFLRKQLRPHN